MKEYRNIKAKKEKNSLIHEILDWIIYIAVVIVVTTFMVNYVAQRTQVSGSSMEPMLQNGDNLIVDKLSYRFKDPERYDIIVFPYKYEENTYYIKRIIGLPGETIQILNQEILINGEVLEENYGSEPMDYSGIAIEEITLDVDEYFVLGDNRNNSSDSRDPSVGVLTRDELLGRAWLRIWPFSSIGVIRHD